MKILFTASMREFFLSLIFLFVSGSQPASQLMASGGGGMICHSAKIPARESGHSPSFTVEFKMSGAVSSSLHALMARMRFIESFCNISGIYFHLMSTLLNSIVEIIICGLSLFILPRCRLNISK